MSERDDGGPAFPMSEEIGGVDSDGHATKAFVISRGMSLRDWFASQVMSDCFNATMPEMMSAAEARRIAAISAYSIADTMLKVRKA